MSPSDLKSRSSTLALFVNILAKKSLGHPVSYFKENRVARGSSPLRPWEYELPPYKLLKSGTKLIKPNLSDTKRPLKRDNNKILAFSFKPNKQESPRRKTFVSEFVHHSDVSEYIKEYRASRHILSEAEKKLLSREVERTYNKLGFACRADRQKQARNKISENASGDAGSISKIEFVDAEDSTTTDDDDDDDDDDIKDDGDEEPIPRSSGDDNLHTAKSSSIWNKFSEQIRHESNHHMILPPIDHRTHQIAADVNHITALRVLNSFIKKSKLENESKDDEIVTKYRLSSLRSNLVRNSGRRRKTEERFREARLPKVVVKKEQTLSVKPTPKKTRQNRVKLTKKRIAADEMTSKNMPKITAENLSMAQQLRSNVKPSNLHNQVGTQINPCLSFQTPFVLNATNSLSNSVTNPFPNRGQSVRDMVMASVKDLQPFSENESSEEELKKPNDDETQDSNCKEVSIDSKLISEIPKQSISSKIYHNLMYKSTTKKLVEELYVPVKDTKRTGTTPYVVSGKPLYKLPPVKIQKQQLESKCLLQKKLHRRKAFAQTKSSITLGDEQRHQARKSTNHINHLLPIKPHKSAMDNLAIHSKFETVAKKQIVAIKNAAC